MTRPLAMMTAMLLTAGVAGTAAAQTASSQDRPHTTAAAKAAKDNPFLSGDRLEGPVVTWFSLGPRRNDLAGGAYDRDEVTEGLRANESITVYGKRHVETPEDYASGKTLGEAWNSDAAQSAFPALGAGCNKYTVCVSPDQKSLRSSLFGD